MYRYNSSSKQPMILDCGHTICKSCLYIIIHRNQICPFDRQLIIKSFTFHRPNFALIQLMSDSISSKPLSSPTSIVLLCPKNHSLSFSPSTSSYYKSLTNQHAVIHCDSCTKTWEGGSFHCKDCMFDICEECYKEEQAARMNSNEEVTCKGMHRMYIYRDNHVFYRRGGKEKKNRCIDCGYKWIGDAWSCRKCKEDLCHICRNKQIYREEMEFLRYRM